MPGISAIGEDPIGEAGVQGTSQTTQKQVSGTTSRVSGPLSMPTNVSFVTAEFDIISKDSASEAATTDQQKILDREGEYWEATLELPRMNRAKFGPWKSFFMKLNGRVQTFKAGDPLEPFPRGSANGTPVVAGPGNAPFVALDGDQDSVDITNVADFDIQDALTVEAWVYPRNLNDSQAIVSKAESAFRDEEWELGINGNGEFFFSIGDGAERTVNSGFTPEATVPYHVAGVFEGDKLRIFVDGEEAAVTDLNTTTSITLAGTDIRIGGRPSGKGWLEGDVSDVRLWETNRTKSEIQNNLAKYLGGGETDLVGYWKLEDGSGLTAKDSTSNDNSGTLKGNARWILTNDRSFVTRGWTADQTGALKEGDNIEVANRLKSLLYDMDVNPVGIGKPTVRPAFRKSVSDGESVITDEPEGEFRLKESNVTWSEEAPYTSKPNEIIIREVTN